MVDESEDTIGASTRVAALRSTLGGPPRPAWLSHPAPRNSRTRIPGLCFHRPLADCILNIAIEMFTGLVCRTAHITIVLLTPATNIFMHTAYALTCIT